MSDYMQEYTLDGDWTLVKDAGLKTFAFQFLEQGQVFAHVGVNEPTDDDVGFFISKNTAGEPSTLGLGALPDDSKVWLKATGGTSPIVVVLAY